MRPTVMISSTVRDLPEHRDQVRIGCERSGFHPRDMMEHLPALNADPIEASLKMVEDADVYLCILGHRYGTVPDGHACSITEMEYDHAEKLGKPRLVFVIHKDHDLRIEDVETGAGATKLARFRERIGPQRVAASFKSSLDLRGLAHEALTRLAKERGGEAEKSETVRATEALHRRSAIPARPAPYVAHPYTLLQARDLVGRQHELNLLTDWVSAPASDAFRARILSIVAIGGMGKSALSWKWFNDIAPNEMAPLAGRMWWSFYESDAAFETFMIRALCYVSGDSDESVRALPWPERETRLLRHLNDEPHLLVLDGLERILVAYHRMDASHLADDQLDEQTANRVAGAIGLPATAAQSFIGQHRLRQTIDPRVGAFLRKLAQVERSRILITTRLYPTALQLPTGYPCPGSYASFLTGLSDDDALGLWRALGVSGSRTELIPIFRSVESHPLLIQALASEVAKYRPAPGDFAQWRADHPKFDPTTLPLIQSRTHILDFALRGLTPALREALTTIVGFRMPASYQTLAALLVGDAKPCANAADLDRALSELEDRGLIGWDREANRYDAHPIVRGVVWGTAGADNQRAVLTALEAHFEPMAIPFWQRVESLADIAPAIEHYNTLVGLGRFDDALQLFADRLDSATLYRLAASRERIEWLERLFPDGIEMPTKLSRAAKAEALHALALSYEACGQPARAAALYREFVAVSKLEQRRHSVIIGLSNLGAALFEIGAFREAEHAFRSAIAEDPPNDGRARVHTIWVNS